MVNFRQIDTHLDHFEDFIKSLEKRYQGKTGQRFFSSYLWMSEHLQQAMQQHLNPLKDALIELGDEYEDSEHTVKYINAGKAVVYLKKIEEELQRIIDQYHKKESLPSIYSNIEFSFQSLPKNLGHLRKRINLIRGFSGLVQEL